jgi:peptidoglycan LD-endopeptidase LytH
MQQKWQEFWRARAGTFGWVVPFDPAQDRIMAMDLSGANRDLDPHTLSDTQRFAEYINSRLHATQAKYAVGGYREHRMIYARSRYFDSAIGGPSGQAEPRRLHLGCDIWGPAGTPVMAPAESLVHSFGFNHHDGDYGATIILTHMLDGLSFHTLYGHLSLNSLKNLQEGQRIRRGEVFTEFGMRFENGNWPPHLHFQIILDMGAWEGDYPGVCSFSTQSEWLANSPDPDLILDLNRYLPPQGQA